MEWDAVMRVLAALSTERVDYVLIGGVAVNLHGIARATEDIDVFLSPTPENVARLRRALHSVYDDPHIDEITAADLCGDYPAVRYVPPDGRVPIDILTRLGEAFSFGDLKDEPRDIDGVLVRLATPETLYSMKRDTVRPLDRADAERLRAAFGLEGGD